MNLSEEAVRDLVRKVVLRTLGPDGVSDRPAAGEGSSQKARMRPVVTEADVLAVPQGGQLPVPAGAVVTPLARDAARDRHVDLLGGARPAGRSEVERTLPTQPRVAKVSGRVVALGADHGGFSAKEDLKGFLSELGYEVIDCGAHSTDPVDYPDLAYAVASLVADGRAWRGIVVDGAGIGSCMAANKVPGVRAAMCTDHATAVNSREHNDANVLTLGGMLLGRNLMRQIAQVWLQTEFGGGRHARRVDKIMKIEARFRGKAG